MVSFVRILVAMIVATAAHAWDTPTTTVTVTASPTATTVNQCNASSGAQCCDTTRTISAHIHMIKRVLINHSMRYIFRLGPPRDLPSSASSVLS